jgi:hypothetical protein
VSGGEAIDYGFAPRPAPSFFAISFDFFVGRPRLVRDDAVAVTRLLHGIDEVGVSVKKQPGGTYEVRVPFYDSNGNWGEGRMSAALSQVLSGGRPLPRPSKELTKALVGLDLSVIRVGD